MKKTENTEIKKLGSTQEITDKEARELIGGADSGAAAAAAAAAAAVGAASRGYGGTGYQ